MKQVSSIGRQVHYVLANGEHRAATIVNSWPSSEQNGICNLTIDLDLANDVRPAVMTSEGPTEQWGYIWAHLKPEGAFAPAPYLLSAASAKNDEETKAPGTWHWPERTEPDPYVYSDRQNNGA